MSDSIEADLVKSINWVLYIVQNRIDNSQIEEYIKEELHDTAISILIGSMENNLALEEVQHHLVRAHLLWSSVVKLIKGNANNMSME